jgi:hypothetical protein
MDVRTVGPKVNQIKANDVPILAGIGNLHPRDTVSLAIPAHKSGAGAPPT